MSSTTAAVHTAGGSYLTDGHSLKSWLLTKDHKRIGILYMISITLFFALGGLFAGAIRLELLTPDGDMFQPDTYNRLFTLHGIVMIFFFLVPSIPATLGNFLLPLMIGAKDLAFPKINLASWYLYNVAGILTLWAIFHGGVDTGWTFYTPFSTTYSNSYVVLVGVAIFIAGFSSIFTGLNFIVFYDSYEYERFLSGVSVSLQLIFWSIVVSLVIGAPFTRPENRGQKVSPWEPVSSRKEQVQGIVDVRRGFDLLISRPEVDPKRLAYVGHSHGATIGGTLAAVERRPVGFGPSSKTCPWCPPQRMQWYSVRGQISL